MEVHVAALGYALVQPRTYSVLGWEAGVMVTKTRQSALRIYDNDQIDYLMKVGRDETNFAEDWALRDGLVNYFEGDLALTVRGEHLLMQHGWTLLGRQVLPSYPTEPAGPPLEPEPNTAPDKDTLLSMPRKVR
jgi:hypothetical protein